MAETYYKQCTYTRPNWSKGDAVVQETAWLPEKLAVQGKAIYFGPKTQIDPLVWVVQSVSDERLPESYLREHERDYKTQRQASDI